MKNVSMVKVYTNTSELATEIESVSLSYQDRALPLSYASKSQTQIGPHSNLLLPLILWGRFRNQLLRWRRSGGKIAGTTQSLTRFELARRVIRVVALGVTTVSRLGTKLRCGTTSERRCDTSQTRTPFLKKSCLTSSNASGLSTLMRLWSLLLKGSASLNVGGRLGSRTVVGGKRPKP